MRRTRWDGRCNRTATPAGQRGNRLSGCTRKRGHRGGGGRGRTPWADGGDQVSAGHPSPGRRAGEPRRRRAERRRRPPAAPARRLAHPPRHGRLRRPGRGGGLRRQTLRRGGHHAPQLRGPAAPHARKRGRHPVTGLPARYGGAGHRRRRLRGRRPGRACVAPAAGPGGRRRAIEHRPRALARRRVRRVRRRALGVPRVTATGGAAADGRGAPHRRRARRAATPSRSSRPSRRCAGSTRFEKHSEAS